MNEVVPTQHPAVVLRSNYQHLRALLAVAMIAVIGLTVAVVILATQNNSSSSTATPASVSSQALPNGSTAGATLDHRGLNATPGPTTRYDGGPEEGTRGAFAAPSSVQSQSAYSYYGGHEEGNAGH